jgi:hypothetical protein
MRGSSKPKSAGGRWFGRCFVGSPDERFGDAWRVMGWLVLAVDGSRFECPRTRENEEGLECAGREKTSPQIFQTTLQHVGTGLLWDMRLGPGTDSERRHLDQMLPGLPTQSLLTADAGSSVTIWVSGCVGTITLCCASAEISRCWRIWAGERPEKSTCGRKLPSAIPLVLKASVLLAGWIAIIFLTNEFDGRGSTRH